MNPFRKFLGWINSIVPAAPGDQRGIISRVWRTAVLWSWGFNALRLASVLVILPLLTRLPNSDFGFYYLLLSIVAVAPLIDFGFSGSVERSVSYAMGGAKQLSAQGLPPGDFADGKPNFALLWKLVHTARVFYRSLTLLLLVVLGGIGTYIVSGAAPETANPQLAWLAWGVALLNAGFEIYSSWWNVFLRGMNGVVAGSRILCLGYAVKLILSCALLLLGAGVLSIFAAGLVSSALIRSLSRRSARRILPTDTFPLPNRAELIGMLRILWPNSWRVGLQLLSSYVTALIVMLICKAKFNLSGAGQYGFSLNIAALIQAMSSVWVTVKWPMIGQLRSRMDLAGIQRLFWSRVWLETLTFLLLAGAALVVTPFLLKIGGIAKDVLPPPWFAILLLNGFLETQMIIWGTFLTTENKVPTLWPIVLANLISLTLVWFLVEKTNIGLGAFAIAPLIAGSLFNYWFWPREGARNLGSSWFRYMFFPPHRRGSASPRNSLATTA